MGRLIIEETSVYELDEECMGKGAGKKAEETGAGRSGGQEADRKNILSLQKRMK